MTRTCKRCGVQAGFCMVSYAIGVPSVEVCGSCWAALSALCTRWLAGEGFVSVGEVSSVRCELEVLANLAGHASWADGLIEAADLIELRLLRPAVKVPARAEGGQ